LITFVSQNVVLFKSYVITNASAFRTPEQYEHFLKIGVGYLANGITKSRIAGFDDKDENIGTIIFSNECFVRDASYNETHL
jgi:hypothetical protein